MKAALGPASAKRPEVRRAIAAAAKKHGLNAKYLGILWDTLNDREPNLLLDIVRAHWRAVKPGGAANEATALAAEINHWQKALWRFSSVGHIGKVGGPKAWQEPVNPLAASQQFHVKLPLADGAQKDITLYLVAGDAGDGNAHDFVVWQRPRLVAPGRPDLLLRDVDDFTREMTDRRNRTFASTAKVLAAADEASRATKAVDIAALAAKHGVDADSLTAWLDCLGIGSSGPFQLDHFTTRLTHPSTYDFVTGWGSSATPFLMANSSNQHVRIPGNMKPHAVCVHPSPTAFAAAGWTSPIAGSVAIEAKVTHAHPECGNGVEWRLELRKGATRQRLAQGFAQGGTPVAIGPINTLFLHPGDLVSLLIGPRDGNHACDLTNIDLVIKASGPGLHPREWNLARDVSRNVLDGNPHADRFGNPAVWHFYSEPVTTGDAMAQIPAKSLLARWAAADKQAEKCNSPASSKNYSPVARRLPTGKGPTRSSIDNWPRWADRSSHGPGRAWRPKATAQKAIWRLTRPRRPIPCWGSIRPCSESIPQERPSIRRASACRLRP